MKMHFYSGIKSKDKIDPIHRTVDEFEFTSWNVRKFLKIFITLEHEILWKVVIILSSENL